MGDPRAVALVTACWALGLLWGWVFAVRRRK